MRWRLVLNRDLQEPPGQNCLTINSAMELLSGHAIVLQRIKRAVGVPSKYWDTYYQPCIDAYAQYVQKFPASEAHHHSHLGGMLEHSLDVVENTLKMRQGTLLPTGADAEQLAGAQDVWTFASVTAALLHDIGKPAVDLYVTVFAHDGRELGRWSPFINPGFHAVGWYQVSYVRDRQFALHEQIALLLVSRILPSHCLAWLSSDLAVLNAWSATLLGDAEAAGVLGEMVHKADGLSVAQNLSGGHRRVQIPDARQIPLSDRLVTGLRFLLDNKTLPLNADGAAGWVIDNELWLVVKRTLDELKSHLAGEGQTGIPGRNERLMDELQQNGLLIPNPQGKAVWKGTVFREGWPRAHTLTMIRIPLIKLWPEPDSQPMTFEGSITAESVVTVLESQAAVESQPLPGDDLPLPPLPDASAGFNAIDTTVRTPVHKAPPPIEPHDMSDEADKDQGELFLNWLRQGLTQKTLPINVANARVHSVPEGVLLVSPGIFKDYDLPRWNHVQKRFQKLKINEKTASKGENIHIYYVDGPRKKNRLIKGFLITDKERVFPNISFPDPNPHLRKQTL